jgi:hypothetical protein
VNEKDGRSVPAFLEWKSAGQRNSVSPKETYTLWSVVLKIYGLHTVVVSEVKPLVQIE